MFVAVEGLQSLGKQLHVPQLFEDHVEVLVGIHAENGVQALALQLNVLALQHKVSEIGPYHFVLILSKYATTSDTGCY